MPGGSGYRDVVRARQIWVEIPATTEPALGDCSGTDARGPRFSVELVTGTVRVLTDKLGVLQAFISPDRPRPGMSTPQMGIVRTQVSTPCRKPGMCVSQWVRLTCSYVDVQSSHMKRSGVKRTGHGVGVRVLKNQTSAVLRRVQRGETLTITDRNRPVAVLLPAGTSLDSIVHELCKTGRLAWGGGKPAGCSKPPRVKGKTVSRVVLEDRR